MSGPLITLTTDFGAGSPYVAAMKGVILAIKPAARLIDLTHSIPPQDLRYTAFFLRSAIPYFAPETIHVVVVDPGVGTDRALLYVQAGSHRLLVPDNGCWTCLLEVSAGQAPLVISLTERRFWREPVSSTFHGRDILAPVAAHLSLGAEPMELGTRVQKWLTLETPSPKLEAGRLTGEVIFVDHFGNLITNLPARALANLPRPLHFRVGGKEVIKQVKSYAEAAPGTAVALISSVGLLELAVNQGSGAELLHAGVGTAVNVTWNASIAAPARSRPDT